MPEYKITIYNATSLMGKPINELTTRLTTENEETLNEVISRMFKTNEYKIIEVK